MVQTLTMRSPLIFFKKTFIGYVLTPSLTCSAEYGNNSKNRTSDVAFRNETERNTCMIYMYSTCIYVMVISYFGKEEEGEVHEQHSRIHKCKITKNFR